MSLVDSIRVFTCAAGLAALLSGASPAQSAPIRILHVGPSGNAQAAAQACYSGDLLCTSQRMSEIVFNAQTPAQLRGISDVLILEWDTGDVNADYQTRLAPYLALGGGVIFESPLNLGDLGAIASGVVNSCGTPYLSTTVTGLTDGIASSFVNCHFELTSHDSLLSAFLREGESGNPVAVYGTLMGGRIVISGADSNYHGVRGSSQLAEANMYNLIVNEVEWVTAVPEPSTALLVSAGLAALGVARRRGNAGARPPHPPAGL